MQGMMHNIENAIVSKFGETEFTSICIFSILINLKYETSVNLRV